MLPLDHLHRLDQGLKAPVEKEAQEEKVREKEAEKARKRDRVANELKVQVKEKTTKVKAKAKARKYNTVATMSKVLAQGMPKIVGIGTHRLVETGKQAHARKQKPNVDFYMQSQQYQMPKPLQMQKREERETMPWHSIASRRQNGQQSDVKKISV